MENSNSKPHAALLSCPGLGHLIPSLELAKRLVLHGFDVTVFTVTATKSSAESEIIHSVAIPKQLEIVELPQADISHLVDADTTLFTRIVIIMREIIPSFRSGISAMRVPPTLLIIDDFGYEALDVAEFDMPKYVYFPSPAWVLSLALYVPTLDLEVEGEYVDRTEPLHLPGCKAVRPEDVLDPMLDRSNQQYREYLRMGAGFGKADGILVNSWEDLEHTTFNALRDKLPIYPIGPLTRASERSKSELLDWLDLQPTGSVMYVSFGSAGTFTAQQLTEIAWGLEQSKHRFLWVVRPPQENDSAGAYFTLGNGGDDVSQYLPEVFLRETRDIGVVVPHWAPQTEILRHPSVGGFLTHCGWNSTLEGMSNGVPMIAWPLYSEQKLNATLITDELGIAVKPEVSPSKRVVRREEIAKMVKRVMEDGEMRNRVQELKKSAERALTEGGSSHNSLSQMAKDAETRLMHKPR